MTTSFTFLLPLRNIVGPGILLLLSYVFLFHYWKQRIRFSIYVIGLNFEEFIVFTRIYSWQGSRGGGVILLCFSYHGQPWHFFFLIYISPLEVVLFLLHGSVQLILWWKFLHFAIFFSSQSLKLFLGWEKGNPKLIL